MKRFEYYEYVVDEWKEMCTQSHDKHLSDLGKKGWELITVIKRTSSFIYFFKRELI